MKNQMKVNEVSSTESVEQIEKNKNRGNFVRSIMKKRTKLTTILSALSFTAIPAFAGSGTSGGGSSVVCFSDVATAIQLRAELKTTGAPLSALLFEKRYLEKIAKVRSYDLVMAELPEGTLGQMASKKRTLVKALPGQTFQNILEAVVTRTQPVSSISDRIEWYVKVTSENHMHWRSVPGVVEIDDGDYRTDLEPQCLRVQAALRRGDRIDYNAELFNRMDPVDQAGLVLHEYLYQVAMEGGGATNSYGVQHVVGMLLSDDVERAAAAPVDGMANLALADLFNREINEKIKLTNPKFLLAEPRGAVEFRGKKVLVRASKRKIGVVREFWDQYMEGKFAAEIGFPKTLIPVRSYYSGEEKFDDSEAGISPYIDTDCGYVDGTRTGTYDGSGSGMYGSFRWTGVVAGYFTFPGLSEKRQGLNEASPGLPLRIHPLENDRERCALAPEREKALLVFSETVRGKIGKISHWAEFIGWRLSNVSGEKSTEHTLARTWDSIVLRTELPNAPESYLVVGDKGWAIMGSSSEKGEAGLELLVRSTEQIVRAGEQKVLYLDALVFDGQEFFIQVRGSHSLVPLSQGIQTR